MKKAIYKNIDCNLYDVYVLHAMRKTLFSIAGQDEKVYIKDLETKNKEEFIILSDDSRIRLDLIRIKDGELIISDYPTRESSSCSI